MHLIEAWAARLALFHDEAAAGAANHGHVEAAAATIGPHHLQTGIHIDGAFGRVEGDHVADLGAHLRHRSGDVDRADKAQ
jgi:hypothetical protein